MIREIQAKVLLNRVKQPDTWFGLKYNMNLYRGCQHQCIYCDSRSKCYQIENFSDILVKINAPQVLRKEIASKRTKGTIGTGSMNDPYMPIESRYNLTGQALEIIAQFNFPVHILTKSDLVLKDLDTLMQIARTYAAVSFTVTTADDALGRLVEPGAPMVTARFRAMRILAGKNILTGIVMMPILPFLEDNPRNIKEIVTRAVDNGASYIIPSFGMTLRDRQREYYYNQLDRYFPGLRVKYQNRYNNQYFAPANNARMLEETFPELCDRYRIEPRIPPYTLHEAKQIPLL